jgi:hypothetical protein
LREALHTKPKSLAVVEEDFESRCLAVSKHKDGPAQRLLAEYLSADGG